MAEKCGVCGSPDTVPGLATRRCLQCGADTPYDEKAKPKSKG